MAYYFGVNNRYTDMLYYYLIQSLYYLILHTLNNISLLTSNIYLSYVIDTLTQTNFTTWRYSLKLTLGEIELHHSLCYDPLEVVNQKEL